MATLIERLRPFPNFSEVSLSDLMRFWAKTKRDSGGCIIWKGSLIGKKDQLRGNFSLCGMNYCVNRVAWFFQHKQDPGSLLVLHTCHVGLCVNSEHLKLGDQCENNQDMFDSQRHTHRGSHNTSAKLTEEEARTIKNSDLSLVSLGKKYGVTPECIGHIRSGRNWKHV